jgi:hypothetical protein
MTDGNNRRLADLPREQREELEADRQREIQDGLTRRHVADATREQQHAAANFARFLREGPALAAKLREG